MISTYLYITKIYAVYRSNVMCLSDLSCVVTLESQKITVICRLETDIGNIVDWKHQNRLETKFLDWKHDYEIGNKKSENNEFRLETKFVDWKQCFEIGNTNR